MILPYQEKNTFAIARLPGTVFCSIDRLQATRPGTYLEADILALASLRSLSGIKY